LIGSHVWADLMLGASLGVSVDTSLFKPMLTIGVPNGLPITGLAFGFV